jgi:hypothetical protein
MSFGFGIGDFITVLQLVNEVRTRYAYAPEQLKEIHSRLVLPSPRERSEQFCEKPFSELTC